MVMVFLASSFENPWDFHLLFHLRFSVLPLSESSCLAPIISLFQTPIVIITSISNKGALFAPLSNADRRRQRNSRTERSSTFKARLFQGSSLFPYRQLLVKMSSKTPNYSAGNDRFNEEASTYDQKVRSSLYQYIVLLLLMLTPSPSFSLAA